MAIKTPNMDYYNDPIGMLNRLVKSSIYGNPHMTIKEHVENVIRGFEIIENAVKTNKSGPFTNGNLARCPIHGWVFMIIKDVPNRCPVCHKNSMSYKARSRKKQKNQGSQEEL